MSINQSRIQATGKNEKEKKTAIQAALSKASVCLGGCEHCEKVLAIVPESSPRLRAINLTPEMCKVRTQCELRPDPVRPPQDAKEHKVCPIKMRAAA